ncbi:glycosyltransferase family 8 protein [Glonium stellatum]|uniref:Glycosyltransferase family 8 protein n=1 Tax=Glonium stellatum TaxID=574774 RepID=A0A8E2F4G1_9PEZI|nr:glycosyltransferase family 8 protein [Glonium stellatum]
MCAPPSSRRARRPYLVSALLFLISLWYLYSRPSPPIIDLNYGLLNAADATSSKYAIATFLSGDQPYDTDAYFVSARMLTYQLLHAPETRNSRPIPFLVLCTKAVPEDKKARLEKDGATVIVVEDVKLRWWIRTGVTRWADQFTKLRLFEMTQYTRILFLDADSLLTGPIDAIFDTAAVRTPARTNFSRVAQIKADEAPVPAQYVFAARSDNAFSGCREHAFPPPSHNAISAGFWVAAPSRELFRYLLSTMNSYRRFDPHTMEQSLLNYAFRREGTMPWRELEPKWSATWANQADVDGGVVALHEKLWNENLGDGGGVGELRKRWYEMQDRMKKYFKDRDEGRINDTELGS